jgi:hypothetical protein
MMSRQMNELQALPNQEVRQTRMKSDSGIAARRIHWPLLFDQRIALQTKNFDTRATPQPPDTDNTNRVS